MSHVWLADAMMSRPTMPESAQAALDCRAGDPLAGMALADQLEESGVNHFPFKPGDLVFFFTVTLYYVGRVEEVGLGWVRLSDASWVHWTGRIGSLFASGDLTRQHGNRRPRTEYLGEHFVWTQSLVSAKRWPGKLPAESL